MFVDDAESTLTDALEDEVRALRATVSELQTVVERMQHRVDAASRTPRVVPASLVADSPDSRPADALSDSTDRRQLLRRAGAAAAGALAGGAALAAASAQPAAAANGDQFILGVTNTATSATIVQGQLSAVNDSGTGLYGRADAAAYSGVYAQANGVDGTALTARATASDGVGVFSWADSGSPLRLNNGTHAIPPATGSWDLGSFLISNKHLYFCVLAGIGPASRWVKLSGAFTPLAASKRIYDSRPGTLPAGGTKTRFANHEARVMDTTVGGAIPTSPLAATAALVNLTATNTNPGGYFSAWKNGVAWPGTSALNWSSSNQTIANQVVVALDSTSKFQVRCEGAGGADLIVDVVGYYL